ncbi:MAG: M23 family metallopeptidase [Bryobacterales bacterium]|nr:M23 family metallopeptidase [Bryobacterales bacterium]
MVGTDALPTDQVPSASPPSLSSQPTPNSEEAYKLPYPRGDSWQTRQGNNDTPDHKNKIIYAYDFSDGRGKCVVAMKAGIVRTHDKGIPGIRCENGLEYGNYITIDHQNGEFSHYAHLKTGTFTIGDGAYVEQGQAVAEVGNTGCSIDQGGGGYHVHVHVTGSNNIYEQSFAFLFDDVDSREPSGLPPGQPVSFDPVTGRENAFPRYTSQNSSRFGYCNASPASPPGPSEADIAWNAIRARARADSRFGSELAGTQYLDPNWGKNDNNTSMRDLRSINFGFSGGRTVRVYHAFYSDATSNLGATIFRDPDQNAWAPWVRVR